MGRTRWALLSVSNTTGIVDFALCLREMGYALVATPGTHTIISAAGIAVSAIEDVTGYPLVFNGLVKSLHPHIFGGILMDHGNPAALAEAEAHGIPVFDIVAINVPTLRRDSPEEIIVGRTDVGGLAVMRAAASNHQQVLVITEPLDYPRVLAALRSPEGPSLTLRRELAHAAWNIVANYDTRVAVCYDDAAGESFPTVLRGEFHRVSTLKYGENPQQQAALYAAQDMECPCIAGARQIHGGPMSYNNMLDADSALELVLEFAAPGAVVVKHAVPVCAAIAANHAHALQKTFAAETSSRVGAVIAVNGPVDEACAGALIAPDRTIDVLVATDFTDAALRMLTAPGAVGGECRLIKTGGKTSPAGTGQRLRPLALRHVGGGILAQTIDTGLYGPGGFRVISTREPSDQELVDLELALLVAKHTRSHACVLAKEGCTLAVSSVQTSRAESAHIAIGHAGASARGCVMASDGVLLPAELGLLGAAGITAVIHSGVEGETESALAEIARKFDMAMLITRMRHFSH